MTPSWARSCPNDSPKQLRRARTRRLLSSSAVLLASVLLGALAAPAAKAAPGDAISIVDGVTEPIFDYASAIRERVFIPVAGVDQDFDGTDDVTVIDIIRPAESNGTLRVPAIINPSPYFTTVGHGNEGEHIEDVNNDGINDHFPLFYDNYFVPRGYAVILAHANGTGESTGCAMQGGPGDIASLKVVVDWLQGRAAGYDAAHNAVAATWHNGKSAMIGKSYDGSLANGVAATGVAGLTTIVPIDAISDWYRYSRTGGIRSTSTHYPSALSNAITNSSRTSTCTLSRNSMNNVDGDASADINQFWEDRDYLSDVGDLTASVFAVHGLNDDNVRMDQLGDYWAALSTHNVPRKLWLAKTGHVDPFDYRRAVWVDTLHRWFDYWLQGVDNGIMNEPTATVETDPGVFEDYASWPVPGTSSVDVHLAGTAAGTAGALLITEGSANIPALSFTGGTASPSETTLMTDPTGSQASRLAFVSAPLQNDLRISGTPVVTLRASLDQTQSNLAAILVDYGASTRTPRTPGEGVITTTVRSTWGSSTADDSADYLEVQRRSADVDLWRVSRGVLDSSNRNSLIEGQAEAAVPGQFYDFTIPLEPYDQVFAKGHTIGVIITTNLSSFTAGAPNATVTVDAASSRISLPIVGGLRAATDAGGLGAPPPVALSFDLAGHATAIANQSVAWATAPTAPTAPAEHGWVFQGWYTDANHTTPFDFTAPITADATAFARWADVADVVHSLQLVPSTQSPTKGDTITVTVNGFDSTTAALGDLSDLVTLTSSVPSDQIDHNRVTFTHASPHIITATLGAASASIAVSVNPAPVVTPSQVVKPRPLGTLSFTGTTTALPLLLLALVLAAAGLVLLSARRRFGAVLTAQASGQDFTLPQTAAGGRVQRAMDGERDRS